MAWLADAIDFLGRRPGLGYLADDGPAAEPTAWAAMALLAHGRRKEAVGKLPLLADWQQGDGSVPVRQAETEPCWTTSLAVTAWQAILRAQASSFVTGDEVAASDADRFRTAATKGRDWLLRTRSEVVTWGDPQMAGHDGTLIGWPWAPGTHAWVEPTALAVLALKASKCAEHSRTREAVRLLIDRLLPGGGCNYGNTEVLGQKLLAHVQPSGLVLLALAGEQDPSGKIERTKSYLLRALPGTKAPQSLAFGLLGLAAHGVRPPEAEAWLAAAASRALSDPAPMAIALLALNCAPTNVTVFPLDCLEGQR